ncbi:MAG TPA: hypothetical protein VFE58_11255 [Tepidisphaeraceae bacterium]|jgi:hypothetical protein|nr:hypothetical protein [Tepidisphaeraceae bacterium]
MSKPKPMTLATHLRLEAKKQIPTRKQLERTEIFFSEVASDEKLYAYLEVYGLDLPALQKAWRLIVPPLPEYESEAWYEYERASAKIAEAVHILSHKALESQTEEKILTKQSGGKSKMPSTGNTKADGSLRSPNQFGNRTSTDGFSK